MTVFSGMELPRLSFDDRYHISAGEDYGLSEELTNAVRLEVLTGGFELQEKPPRLPDLKEKKRIGKRQITCPLCGYDPFLRKGDKKVWLTTKGKVTGVEILTPSPCPCVYYEHFWRLWTGVTSPMYEDIALETLRAPNPRTADKANKKIIHAVNKLINLAQREYDKSFTILGPSRVGKSAIGYALMRAACQRKALRLADGRVDTDVPSIWNITAERMFDEHHRFVMGYDISSGIGDGSDRLKEPTVSVRGIERARNSGVTPFLMLDELDKVTMTTPRLRVLSAIVDSITSQNGQLIVITNLRKQGLIDLVGDVNWGERGNAIYERLTMRVENTPENTRCYFQDLYDSDLSLEGGTPEPVILESTSSENHTPQVMRREKRDKTKPIKSQVIYGPAKPYI